MFGALPGDVSGIDTRRKAIFKNPFVSVYFISMHIDAYCNTEATTSLPVFISPILKLMANEV